MDKKKETIEIAMCFNDYDGNYSLLIETAIVSILENNKKNNIRFHLIYNTIPKKNITNIKKLIEKYNQECKCYPNIEKKFKTEIDFFKSYLKENVEFWDSSVAYKLFLYKIVSERISKILYLDSDIIVNKSLSKLYSISLRNKSIAGVKGELVYNKTIMGGVVLFNLEKLREFNFFKSMKKVVKKNFKKILFTEEWIIKKIFPFHELKFLPKKYNFLIYTNINKKKIEDVTILHFAGYRKYHSSFNFLSKELIKIAEKYVEKTSFKLNIENKMPFFLKNFFFYYIFHVCLYSKTFFKIRFKDKFLKKTKK